MLSNHGTTLSCTFPAFIMKLFSLALSLLWWLSSLCGTDAVKGEKALKNKRRGTCIFFNEPYDRARLGACGKSSAKFIHNASDQLVITTGPAKDQCLRAHREWSSKSQNYVFAYHCRDFDSMKWTPYNYGDKVYRFWNEFEMEYLDPYGSSFAGIASWNSGDEQIWEGLGNDFFK